MTETEVSWSLSAESTGSQYRAMSIDRVSNLKFLSGKLGPAKPEDLLWVAIGDANLVALQTLPPGADTSLNLVDAEPLLVQKPRHGNAVHAPAEGTAPEFWAVILIGAGLIWSQLRRKTRHSAIRFTAPQESTPQSQLRGMP